MEVKRYWVDPEGGPCETLQNGNDPYNGTFVCLEKDVIQLKIEHASEVGALRQEVERPREALDAAHKVFAAECDQMARMKAELETKKRIPVMDTEVGREHSKRVARVLFEALKDAPNPPEA